MLLVELSPDYYVSTPRDRRRFQSSHSEYDCVCMCVFVRERERENCVWSIESTCSCISSSIEGGYMQLFLKIKGDFLLYSRLMTRRITCFLYVNILQSTNPFAQRRFRCSLGEKGGEKTNYRFVYSILEKSLYVQIFKHIFKYSLIYR